MLNEVFHAKKYRPAQSRKRRDVEVLARNAAGSGIIYPMQDQTMVGVEQCQECRQLAGELRLRHLDCNRALLRRRGPQHKAAELKLHDNGQGAERKELPLAVNVAVSHLHCGESLVAPRTRSGHCEGCSRVRFRRRADLCSCGVDSGDGTCSMHALKHPVEWSPRPAECFRRRVKHGRSCSSLTWTTRCRLR